MSDLKKKINYTVVCVNEFASIYTSEIYEKVQDIETLYRESPAYVFRLLQDELQYGHIIQTEV